MGTPYSRQEILAIRSLRARFGHITYYLACQLEEVYFSMTGIHRAGGPIYMAAWRDEQGLYDRLFV